MNLLTGPRMYYSLLGPFGVVLGAKSRLLRKVIQSWGGNCRDQTSRPPSIENL